MFRLLFGILSIFGHEHALRPLTLHDVPSSRVVQHLFLILGVIQDSNRLFLFFLCVILDQIGNHRRFV